MKKTIEVFVFGHVQGVWFRDSAKKKAIEYGIRGYAKNMADGSVKVLAQHEDQEKMNLFLEWLKRGPDTAQVDRLNKKEIASEEFIDFQVRY